MKKIYSLFVTFMFIFGITNVNAQDKNNKWQFSFGANAVDLEADKNTQFADLFDVQNNWNASKSPISTVSLSRYLDTNLSLGVGASFNSISNYATGLELDGTTNDYFTVDAMLKYDLSDAFTIGKFEPFVGIGPGWTWFDDQDGLTGNVSVGVNYWFNDVFGLTLMSEYKNNYDNVGGANLLDEGETVRWSATLSVKFGGKDTDGDGVYDEYDVCPDVFGLEEFDGCPDSDSDGIQDSEDECPFVAGLVEFNGCPDTDGDGISDNKDRCPTEAGSADLGGCPDNDGDGIANLDDKCPDVAGPAANNGCPWPDSDGDSVVDKDDKCPNVAGTVANNGCPEVPTKADKKEILNYSLQIKFGFGSTKFTDGMPPVLDQIVAIIMKYPNAKFKIEGHTDSIGTKDFNQSLSEKRAEAVLDYLTTRGISADRLSAKGFGEDNPIDSNVSSRGRAKNRRVEIIFKN